MATTRGDQDTTALGNDDGRSGGGAGQAANIPAGRPQSRYRNIGDYVRDCTNSGTSPDIKFVKGTWGLTAVDLVRSISRITVENVRLKEGAERRLQHLRDDESYCRILFG